MEPLALATVIAGILLLMVVIIRPRLLVHGVGKFLGLVVVIIYPTSLAFMGTHEHIERSKTVAYCTSCHAMEKYGKSLSIDNPRFLPAAHVQNGRVPRETACFSCHTTYTLYGDLNAKLHGLKHVWVAYLGKVPEKISLYAPYNNRECLHCHDGARSFEDTSEHKKQRAQIQANQVSCVSSDCHSSVHAVGELDTLKLWNGKAEADK